jgi:hypothetical protein
MKIVIFIILFLQALVLNSQDQVGYFNGFQTYTVPSFWGMTQDGSKLAISNSLQLYIFDTQTNKDDIMLIDSVFEVKLIYSKIYFSSDKKRLLHQTLKIIDLENLAIIDSIDNSLITGSSIKVFDASPDLNYICFTDFNKIKIYDFRERKIIFEVEYVESVSFSDFKFISESQALYIKNNSGSSSLFSFNINSRQSVKLIDVFKSNSELHLLLSHNKELAMIYGVSNNSSIEKIQILDLTNLKTLYTVDDAFIRDAELSFSFDNQSFVYKDKQFRVKLVNFKNHTIDTIIERFNYFSDYYLLSKNNDIYFGSLYYKHVIRYSNEQKKFYPVKIQNNCEQSYTYLPGSELLIDDDHYVINIMGLKYGLTYELFDNSVIAGNPERADIKEIKYIKNDYFAQLVNITYEYESVIRLFSINNNMLSSKEIIRLKDTVISSFYITKDLKYLYYTTMDGLLIKLNLTNNLIEYKKDFNHYIYKMEINDNEELGVLYYGKSFYNTVPLVFNASTGEKIFTYDIESNNDVYRNNPQIDFANQLIYEFRIDTKGKGNIYKWSLLNENIEKVKVPNPFAYAKFTDDFNFLFTVIDSIVTIYRYPELSLVKSFVISQPIPFLINNSSYSPDFEKIFITSDNKYLILQNCLPQTIVFDLEKDKVLNVKSDFKNISHQYRTFPNPVNDLLTVDFCTEYLNEFQIYNLLGESVQKGKFFQDNSIDVHTLSKGYYFIRITNANSLISIPFLKY